MKNSEKMLLYISLCQLCDKRVDSVRLSDGTNEDKLAIYRCHGDTYQVRFKLEELADAECTGIGNEIMRMLMTPFAPNKSDGSLN